MSRLYYLFYGKIGFVLRRFALRRISRNASPTLNEDPLYYFDRYDCTSTKKLWRCDKRNSDGCKARIHTDAATGQVVRRINAHTHGFDAAEVEASAVMTHIRRRAEDTVETPAVIMNEAFEDVSTAVLGQLPRMSYIRRTIQRTRAAIDAPPSLPISRASFVIPEAYQTHYGERFLLYDSVWKILIVF
uniref:FLYWCH-type domain-containing protein n=1 Tax=Trichuris muris TaxID=70415 RepID=A0A5S6QL56_TRIMR